MPAARTCRLKYTPEHDFLSFSAQMTQFPKLLSGPLMNPRLLQRECRYCTPDYENFHKGLSDGEMVCYIDVNEWIANEEGYLPDEMTGDGCHLYVDGYRAWAQWIFDTAGDLRIP